MDPQIAIWLGGDFRKEEYVVIELETMLRKALALTTVESHSRPLSYQKKNTFENICNQDQVVAVCTLSSNNNNYRSDINYAVHAHSSVVDMKERNGKEKKGKKSVVNEINHSY